MRYNNRLETLSFWGCTPSLTRRQCLALVNQVSSGNLRELNISLDSINRDRPEDLQELCTIDTLLQGPAFANLDGLNVGLPEVEDSMEAFFPRAAARDLLRVLDNNAMSQLRSVRDTEVRLWT